MIEPMPHVLYLAVLTWTAAAIVVGGLRIAWDEWCLRRPTLQGVSELLGAA